MKMNKPIFQTPTQWMQSAVRSAPCTAEDNQFKGERKTISAMARFDFLTLVWGEIAPCSGYLICGLNEPHLGRWNKMHRWISVKKRSMCKCLQKCLPVFSLFCLYRSGSVCCVFIFVLKAAVVVYCGKKVVRCGSTWHYKRLTERSPAWIVASVFNVAAERKRGTLWTPRSEEE